MDGNSLTRPSDWDSYFTGQMTLKHLYKHYITGVLEKYIWNRPVGKIFELGCGASRMLARSGRKGWQISGIDFNENLNQVVLDFADRNSIQVGEVITGDLCTYDQNRLENQFDALVSSATLCHFRRPCEVLKKWSSVLKPGAPVFTILPNPFSINFKIMKKLKPEETRKYKDFSLEEIDCFHKNAGLQVVRSAYFTGGYDINFYIPWDLVKKKMRFVVLYKIFRHLISVLEKIINMVVPFSGNRFFNRHIIAVYCRPFDNSLI